MLLPLARGLQVKKVLDEITAKFGTVNTVVQCAGIGVAGKVLSKKGPHDLSLFTKVRAHSHIHAHARTR